MLECCTGGVQFLVCTCPIDYFCPSQDVTNVTEYSISLTGMTDCREFETFSEKLAKEDAKRTLT